MNFIYLLILQITLNQSDVIPDKFSDSSDDSEKKPITADTLYPLKKEGSDPLKDIKMSQDDEKE